MEEIMEVDNKLHVELDVGNLCILTAARLSSSINSDPSENYLKSIAVDSVQLLMNEIFKLPSEFHEHVPVAKLPEPTTRVPREKPVPKEKPMTKWETFAKAKGIQKHKKEKLVWDNDDKDWRPQFGFKGIKNKDDWMVELPNHADPNHNYFAKKKEEKRERVAKNEYQRLRNIAASQKLKVTNLESVDKADKTQLSMSLAAAKTATASLGRFTDKLPKERPPKNSMKKRKFQSNFPSSMNGERDNNLKILQDLDKKKPKLDVEEGVQLYMKKGFRKPLAGVEDERRFKPDKKIFKPHNKSKSGKFQKNSKSFGGKGKSFGGKGKSFGGKGKSFGGKNKSFGGKSSSFKGKSK